MEPNVTTNAMSTSLLARHVYCVCFTERDSLDNLRGELALAREKFFTGGQKALRLGKKQVIRGYDGRLRGKITRRSFYWKKSIQNVTGTGRLALEESFDQKGGYVVVYRDFRSLITSRVFFDKSHLWLKSEYYEPWDSHTARIIFKPVHSDDLVERFDWDPIRKLYRSTMLFPVPYLEGKAEQSLVNAQFGEPKLLVSSEEGVFCYCPQQEAKKRKEALKDLQSGTLMILPAWEVKEGSLSTEKDEDWLEISFPSLEEYAKVEMSQELKAAPLTETPAPPFQEGEEFAPEKEPVPQEEPSAAGEEAAAPQEEPAESLPPEEPPVQAQEEEPLSQPGDPADPESLAILRAARAAALNTQESQPDAAFQEPWEAVPSIHVVEAPQFSSQEPGVRVADSPLEQQGPLAPQAGSSYRGELREGKPWGRGRTEQKDGLTSYEGEFRDGKREGFGAYYYKDGNLCYAGSWKDDKKDGLGVSFRDSDHALHVARWKEGAPEEFVSLFDKEGNLRYGGRIQQGKKQGPGVSYNTADGTVFVGKWLDGQPTGLGSVFDREGNLIYYGGWKDGKRWGHGTEFDPTGAIVFDGEWKDGKYFNGILYQKRDQEGLPDTDTTGPTWEL